MSKCIHDPACTEAHHAWACPLSDPLSDCRAALSESLTNPILDQARVAMLNGWLPDPDPPRPTLPV